MSTYTGQISSGPMFLRGKQRKAGLMGPPSLAAQAKEVDAGGVCAPFCTKRGKVKPSFILGFTKAT